MAPPVLDQSNFDRFVSENETAVIGFIGLDAEAMAFAALADAVLGQRPGVAFAQVHGSSRALFELFGLDGTATAIFRDRVGMYLEAGLPLDAQLVHLLDRVAAVNMARARTELEQERAARESLAVHRVCPATRRGRMG